MNTQEFIHAIPVVIDAYVDSNYRFDMVNSKSLIGNAYFKLSGNLIRLEVNFELGGTMNVFELTQD